MAKLTNAQLIQQLSDSHVAYQRLEQQFAALAEEHRIVTEQLRISNALCNSEAVTRKPTSRAVFEFDPTIPGDFARASALAREVRGSVKRMSVRA